MQVLADVSDGDWNNWQHSEHCNSDSSRNAIANRANTDCHVFKRLISSESASSASAHIARLQRTQIPGALLLLLRLLQVSSLEKLN